MAAPVPTVRIAHQRGTATLFIWGALVLALGRWAAEPAAGQSFRPSPYRADYNPARSYSPSAYRRSPYAPDYSYNVYQPRNYHGLVSNYEFTRQKLAAVAYSAGLQPPSIYTPWYDGPYRVRYGLGYYGPYYPRYYYGYSDYYRPWYRWYRPWGGLSWWGWSVPLPVPVPGLPWGLAPWGWGPVLVPALPYGAAAELAVPGYPIPGTVIEPPCDETVVPPVEEVPGTPAPGSEVPQQPPPVEPAPQNNEPNAAPSGAGQNTGQRLLQPQATPISEPTPVRNYGPVRNYDGAYYW